MENNYLSKTQQLVGVVLQTENPGYITFIANHNADLSHGTILGLEENDGEIILCEVVDIAIEYHLKDQKRFFSGFSAEDKLHLMVHGRKDAPLYTQEIKAVVLGRYMINESLVFIPSPQSVALFTPKALQAVYKLDPKLITIIFGLDPNGLKIGNMEYPFKIEARIPVDIFNSHMLVSGVTGAGKSRLVGTICKKFALSGGCVTLIDPHDEYTNLFAADPIIDDIRRYEIAPCNWSPKKWNIIGDSENTKTKVFQSPLIISEDQLTPASLCKLLPYISEQQEQEIHDYFYKAKAFDGSLIENLKRMLEEVLSNISYKKNEKIGRPDRIDVLQAIINKLSFKWDKELNAIKISDNIYLSSMSTLWQDPSMGKISILCGDYNKLGTGKRFLATIFEQFLRKMNLKSKINHLLVIEEAHLIFKLHGESIQKALDQLLREARKFGITILIVTQNIFDIPEDTRNQFQNLFTFRDLSTEKFKILEDKQCFVKLKTGKTDFVMKSDECLSLIDFK